MPLSPRSGQGHRRSGSRYSRESFPRCSSELSSMASSRLRDKLSSGPVFVGLATVRFTETDVAVVGIPHCPRRIKVLGAVGFSEGPPYGPVGLRVSMTLHGVKV